MAIEKILKRKDAASVIVAVAVGLVLYQFLSNVSTEIANKFSAVERPALDGIGWQDHYFVPFMAMLVELAVLELLIWAYTMVNKAVSNQKR